MKLQHLTVIFILIFLPIILITSYYIQRQVDTIDLQLSYDSKLLDATYDAMMALEINTANEDLSTVTDSLRSIIEASNNIFFNTLATNMGVSNASKSYVQPYIPAILYTLYDGYYIYSPASSPTVCTDSYGNTIDTSSYGVTYVGTMQDGNGNIIGIYKFDESNVLYSDSVAYDGDLVDYDRLVQDDIGEEYGQLLYENKGGTYSAVLHSGCSDVNYDTKYTQSYILKSYVPYSAHYVYETNGKNIDIVINYTLDNFMTVTGTIDGIYYTKSGYLINDELVASVTVDGTGIDWYTYSESQIDELLEGGSTIEVTIKDETSDGDIINTTISSNESSDLSDTVSEDVVDAVEYYVKAWMFSSWVYDNLSILQEKNIDQEYNTDTNEIVYYIVDDDNDESNLNLDTSQSSKLMYNFQESEQLIFGSDPEDDESVFNEHKRNVIKNSITYNLALAMVTYSQMSSLTEYDLPIISETEWDSILSNVSIVTFMQGLSLGLKYYNNYAIATSTNNEMTITEDEIYYVPITTGIIDGVTYNTDITDRYILSSEVAHRIDCTELSDEVDYYVSFTAKDIKYDGEYDDTLARYVYDYKALLDYYCIVNSNYYITNGSTVYRGNSDLLYNLINGIGNFTKLKAYRIAVAKERNNLYKPIAFNPSYGYEIVNFDGITVSDGYIISEVSSSKKIGEIYQIDIVYENTTIGGNTTTDEMSISLNGNISAVKSQTITKGTNTATREYEISNTSDEYLSDITFEFAYGSSVTVKSIKIYYK